MTEKKEWPIPPRVARMSELLQLEMSQVMRDLADTPEMMAERVVHESRLHFLHTASMALVQYLATTKALDTDE